MLGQALSWLMGSLQDVLFPMLEERRNSQLTEKEKQLVSLLELVQI
jgi:hypothetical protein